MSKTQVRWIVVAAVGVALVAGLALLFAPRPVPVDAARVVSGPIAESVQDQGWARVREAYVVSAPVSGRLERLGLKVGDHVTAGETMVARIRPAPADLLDPRSRAQAEAAVAAANAAVSAARSERERLAADARRADLALSRTRTLAERGFAARSALDNAEAEAKAARAAVRAAEADLKARQAQLVSARYALMGPDAAAPQAVAVTAPATGYVTRVLQESERTVAMGSPLLEIGDSQGLEAQIEFLSQDAVRIHEGMTAELYDWGGAGTIPAVVRRVEPQGFTKVSALGVEEQRVLVMLQFTGAPSRWSALGPGYRVWGRVYLRREPAALKVPLGALVRSGGRWAVFRIDGARARLTPVEVGALTDREAEVRSGLSAGQAVVLFPSDRVRDGVRVAARREAS
ncbi:MAG: efflux RND transporter periplasmic adaptor subunit [Proteobacteria bacterium]|nr:efflux RND transporter periplasmic adaptor subunit [Pseudomonadota bacterium]